MADSYNIYQQCLVCKGSGKVTINNGEFDPTPPQEIDCTLCKGTGEIFWGQMREEEIE